MNKHEFSNLIVIIFISYFFFLPQARSSSDGNVLQNFERSQNIMQTLDNHLKKSEKTDGKILYFLNNKDGLVLLSMGRRDGLVEGSILNTYRYLEQDQGEIKINTGTLKIRSLERQQSIAQVIADGTEHSKEAFPKYSGMMSGDWVARKRYSITRNVHVLPRLNLSYFELFEEPKGNPRTFSLSERGKMVLKRQLEIFKNKRVSMLLVKGYTDQLGTKEKNQIESYHRALTIKQFMIREMQFDGERIEALGMGEYAPQDRSNVKGHKVLNRRIVINAVSIADL